MRKVLAMVAMMAMAGLTGCAGSPQPSAAGPQLVVENAWVRTTTGAKDPMMTGAFLTIANPGAKEVVLTSVETEAAGVVQLHEMVMANGKMAMQETKAGIPVPAGGHAHLAPGGYHIMLMKVAKPLLVGDEVALTLRFSDGTVIPVKAPVKEFVEEEDHYHSPMPTPSN